MQTGTCPYVVKLFVQYLGLGENDPRRCAEAADHDIAKLDIPAGTQSFFFFKVVSVLINVDGYPVKMEQQLGYDQRMYFYGGELYSLEEAKKRFDDVDYGMEEGSLFLNIRLANGVGGLNHVTHVIQQPDGNLAPFRRSDMLVPITAPVTA